MFDDYQHTSKKHNAKPAQAFSGHALITGQTSTVPDNKMSVSSTRNEIAKMHPYPSSSASSKSSATGEQLIQMAPGDKHDLTSEGLSGNPFLEKVFDAEAIVKVSHQGNHVRKIQKALMDLNIELPDHGDDGSYGEETERAVIEFQQTVGMAENEWDGIVGRKTLGLLDKSLRNGSIQLDTDLAENDFKVFDPKKEDNSCKTKKTDKPCDLKFFNKIDPSIDKAIAIVDKVLNSQLPPKDTKTAKYSQIYTTLFMFNDKGTVENSALDVRQKFVETKAFMNSLKTKRERIRCGTECDGGCRAGAPAYHTSKSDDPVPHKITFCDSFDKHAERLSIIIHECHHAAVDGSRDFAYPAERLIKMLDFNNARKNAASYHLYAASVVDPEGTKFGQEVADTNTIGDQIKKKNVDQVLAFIEHWFSLNTFDVSIAIQQTQEAKANGSYDTKKHRNTIIMMEDVFSKWFGLTRPPVVPTEEDINKLKAIEERIKTMKKVFSKPFSIVETAGQSDWINEPTTHIQLNPETLSLGNQDMATAFLQELVNSVPHITPELEPLYVGTINDLRRKRNLGP